MYEYIFNRNGEAVCFRNSHLIFNLDGHPVGQIHGSRVFTLSGAYVGELHRDMIVNKYLGRPNNVGPVPDGCVGCPPAPPRNRPSVTYGYPDVSHKLFET